jgi:hypothetical protein
VPQFSKYLSGFAAPVPPRVQVGPSWLSDEEVSEALRGERPRTGSGRLVAPAPAPSRKRGDSAPSAKMFDRTEKKKVPDQKSVLANERTLLAWVRTTMLILYGSSFFLENDLPGPTNLIMGWLGLVTGVGLITCVRRAGERESERAKERASEKAQQSSAKFPVCGESGSHQDVVGGRPLLPARCRDAFVLPSLEVQLTLTLWWELRLDCCC